MFDQRSSPEKARQLLLSYRDEDDEAHGRRPSDEELLRLLDGSLSEGRAQEALSHLANDPELTQHWYALARARDESPKIAEEPRSQWELVQRGLNNWVGNWRYAALGLALLAAVIITLHLMEAERDDSGIQLPRELDPGYMESHFQPERETPGDHDE